ncbi:MAG: polysaccharide deacetylase family protein [Chlorobi bacterium]|nr:polysaccharide deacetylase family protein [Chlorobiota bacterium]
MRKRMNTGPVYYSGYTGISILFIIFLFAIMIGYQQLDWPGWVVFIPVFIYLILLILGSVFICFNFYFYSRCKGKTKEKEIAITFDDGPHPEITPRLLNVLEQQGLPATFFYTGQNVNKYKTILKKAFEKGHIVANHSYSHSRWFDFYNSRKVILEMENTNKEIEQAIRKKPLLFRPPYGVANPALGKAIHHTGMMSVGWSLRSFDTVNSPEKVLKKLKKKTNPGDIVLFHDTLENTPGIIEKYARWLKENGFEVVPLNKMLKIEVYEEI